MAKHHIKIRGEYDRGKKIVKVSLLEQTHFDREFGPDTPEHLLIGGYGPISFKHDGLCMYSQYGGFEYYNQIHYQNRNASYWLALPARAGYVSHYIEVPVDEWPRIKRAVELYNEWGDTQ